MNKLILSSVFAFAAIVGTAQAAEVVVRVGPPRAVAERRIARPGPRHVWIPGYQRWEGRGYVWVPGRWELPPRPRARWVEPRWQHRRDGYVFVEGRWR